MSKQRKAFTLVELLVVIAIIGILFVVLISKVDFATEKSKTTGVQTDFRSYQVAIETVARENAGLSVLVDNDAEGEAKYAELEKALNKNLDPKLHVEIDADGKISTEAKDPWKEQYLGAYLAPDEDGTVKDRGAIVMYSKGSNLKLGTTAVTENGVVNVTLESGKETDATDDYSLAVIYTYVNGYGEIQTSTGGFSNNQGDTVGNVNNGGNVMPSNPSEPSDPSQDGDGDNLSNDPYYGQDPFAGLSEFKELQAGIYAYDDYDTPTLIVDWDTLIRPIDEGGYGMDTDNTAYVWPEGTEYPDATIPSTVIRHIENTMDVRISLVVVGDSITKIGQATFWDSFVSYVVLPNTINAIEREAFGNFSLERINIPVGVQVIGPYAFFDASFSHIALPNGLISIEDSAFSDCQELQDIIIPESVENLGTGLFSTCYSLESVTILANRVFTCDEYMFSNCNSLAAIYVPADLVDDYKATDGWSDYADLIKPLSEKPAE